MPFYFDECTEYHPELHPVPGLCVICKKRHQPSEKILCTLTRMGDDPNEEFVCGGFEKID